MPTTQTPARFSVNVVANGYMGTEGGLATTVLTDLGATFERGFNCGYKVQSMWTNTTGLTTQAIRLALANAGLTAKVARLA